LAEAGYRLIFIPEAKVWHTHDRTVAEYARRKFFIGYWKSLVVQRHPAKLIRDSHTPQVLKLQMGLAALGAGFLGLGLLRRLRPLAAGGLLAWLALGLSGLPFYRKLMARDPGVLLIAPWLIFIRAWALGLGFLLSSFRLILIRHN
ncbi:MAG: hypothetical protein GWN13_15680, partial [Phycisphaerae bacterium]|nr:hypothetical protein [Phycisphaerae bacterium]